MASKAVFHSSVGNGYRQRPGSAFMQIRWFRRSTTRLRLSRWGVDTQFRRFHQDGSGADSSIIVEISWYFRNDVGNSNSHWIKLNIERQLERMQGPPSTIVTLQYYFYR